jgi:hypothetical protein
VPFFRFTHFQTGFYVQVTTAEHSFFGEATLQVPEQQAGFAPVGVLQELLFVVLVQSLLTHFPPQHLSPLWHPALVAQAVSAGPLHTPAVQVAPAVWQSDVKLQAPPFGIDPAVLHVAPVAIQILLQQLPEIH